MSDATSSTPGEVLVDETAPTGTYPTALTTDGLGDFAYPSAANNTIVTSGGSASAEAAAGYQDDTLVITGSTTNTILISGHRASPSLLGGSVRVMGSVATNVISVSSNYAVTPLDSVVVLTATGKRVTLPPAAVAGSGKQITVKNAPGVSSTTVEVAGGGTIDGNTSATVTTVTRFLSNGSVWYVV